MFKIILARNLKFFNSFFCKIKILDFHADVNQPMMKSVIQSIHQSDNDTADTGQSHPPDASAASDNVPSSWLAFPKQVFYFFFVFYFLYFLKFFLIFFNFFFKFFKIVYKFFLNFFLIFCNFL